MSASSVPVFKNRSLRRRKKLFEYEINEEPVEMRKSISEYRGSTKQWNNRFFLRLLI